MSLNNKFYKRLTSGLLTLVLFLGTFAAAFASGGGGGGTNPLTFTGAYLTTISGNTSTTGENISGKSDIPGNPVIKLVFSNNVVNSSVWDSINSKAITMADSSGNPVEINVSKISDTDNPNESTNIFVTPANPLAGGKTYTFTINKTLEAKNGNTLGTTQTVSFTIENVPPVILGADNTTINVGSSFDPLSGVSATDNVDGDVTSKIAVTGTVDTSKPGTNTLTYTVSDNAGNPATVTRTVTVADNEKPVITGADDETIFVGDTFNRLSGVTAADDVDGDVTSNISVDASAIDTSKPNTYTLTYTVSDNAGNTTTVTRRITVVDNEKPVIIGADDESINIGATFNPLSGVTAIDNADGDLTTQISVDGTVDTKTPGPNQITYTVSDSSGNVTIVTRTITVLPDTVSPVITGANDTTINAGNTFEALEGVSATDNIDGDVTPNITVTGTVDTATPGTYSLIYTVSDKAGNIASITRKITVVDNVKPVITGANDLTIKVGDTFDPLKGVSATDNVDGDLTSKISVTGTVNNLSQGTYTLTYTVSDNAGNKISQTRTITVIDPVVFSGAYLTTITGNSSSTGGEDISGKKDIPFNPVIKLIFTKNVVDSTVWNINSKAFTLKDSNGNAIAIYVKCIPDTVNTNEKRNIFVSPVKQLTPGKTYILTINGGLTANNQTTLGQNQTITFTVKHDTVKPVISGAANKTIAINSAFNPKTGVTAKDDVDGDLTSIIKVTGTVNTKVKGTYTLTYTVTDKAGNVTTVTRKITVIDNIKPVISGAANKTIALNSAFNPKTGVTAKDNVDGNLTSIIKVTGTVNTKKKGTYTLTYTVSDKSGNVTKVTRKITVIDNVKPVISGAGNKTIRLYSAFNPRTGVTSKDNVDGNLTGNIKVTGTVNTRKKGTYKLTYTVTDKSGNKTVVTRKITVK